MESWSFGMPWPVARVARAGGWVQGCRGASPRISAKRISVLAQRMWETGVWSGTT